MIEVDAGAGADAAIDATCVAEALPALCTAAGYQCGDASFTDRCGAPVAGSCGTCATGTCGADHRCAGPSWRAQTWPSLAQSRIFAMASAPGAAVVWAGGGALGAGELWKIERTKISILSTPTTIAGVHALGAEVWAVGNAGVVVHGTGDDFAVMPSAALASYNLGAVWGFGPSNVWVTTTNGVNSIAHWDGAAWQPSMLPTTAAIPGCTGLWAAAADDLWAVCRRGEIVHWDGAAWTKVTSPTTQDLQAIYGFAANNVWAVGNGNTLLHWNGTAWSAVTAPAGGALVGLWGAAANDIYAVGSTIGGGHVIHYNGAAWAEVVTTGAGTALDRIAGAQGEVYAVGIPTLLIAYR